MRSLGERLKTARREAEQVIQEAKEWIAGDMDELEDLLKDLENPIKLPNIMSNRWKDYPMREHLYAVLSTLHETELTALRNL